MPSINASIITIGDELLIGQTIDTNSAFIGQELNKIGIWVKRRVAVGDVYEDIWNALEEERKQSRLIIVTGGLGPTADDITKPLLCDYFGTTLVRNESVLAHLHHLYVNVYKRKVMLIEQNIKQADLPESCTILHNEFGSASGMWFEAFNPDGEKIVFISLPGVPFEMKKIITDVALPKIIDTLGGYAVVHKVLSTFGMGESLVAARLSAFESNLPTHVKLAYLPGYGMVKLRLTGTGLNAHELGKEMSRLDEEMYQLLSDITISRNDDPMEVIVGGLLKEKNRTMSTAESCTGGYIAHLITSIAGSSDFFLGSIVSYSNEVKHQVLGVVNETLNSHGAVSEETVIEMVQGTLSKLHTDYAIATSGIMGPGGGTAEKPVGTVWVAAGNANKIVAKKLSLGYDRRRNIETTALQALNLLRKFIIEDKS